MTDTEIDSAIEDARQANEEFLSETVTVRCLKILFHSPTLGEENNFENPEN